jgi:small subunit ribosomal protein S7
MRKSKPKKRIILPDPKFNDVQVTRFVNNMMYDGKKSIAYSIFYDAVELAEKKVGENGLEMWKRALNNVMPAVEVKSRRVGAAVKKKEDTHKMAEANKAFSHFRF